MGIFRGPNIVTDGLVLYLDAANTKSYPGSGTVWYDLSGNSNNGILTNSPTFNSNNNGNFIFDGVNDYISLAYNSSFNIRNGLTFHVILKRNSNYNQLSDCFILSRPPSWYFYDAYNSGYIQGDVFIDGVRRGACTTILPYDNQWYTINYTYNGFTGLAVMYKNGINVNSVQLTGLSNYLIDYSSSNFINIFYNTVGRSYYVANLILYNRALSPEEILQNYNATKSRFNL